MTVIDRILDLSEHDVTQALSRTLARFSCRHDDLAETLERNFQLVAHRVGAEIEIGTARRQLIGAYFTHEYALEAAALFNPSIVMHPDQKGCQPGEARFVMSLRAVGEGHLSSIEFRTGTIGADSGIHFDSPGRFLDTGCVRSIPYDRNLFQKKVIELGQDDENARFLWSILPRHFTAADLNTALAELAGQHVTRGDATKLADRIRWIAASNYLVEFDDQRALPERVLWPSGPAEDHGMEDARFVRFTDGADAIYYATYTAFDGSQVAPHLLETSDFRTFTVSQLSGPSARNKGMALFPRKIAGRYAALSRWDRESNAIAYSDVIHDWPDASTVQSPARPWELIQLGNCGSPIETPMGWLVFTHGVGPMREYAIGAALLDLDEPERLIGGLSEPLLVADESEREGYVPNVVYSCGAMVHGDTVVLPYGCSDSSVRIALVNLGLLLERLRSS
ncbi:MAG TPA: glycoside hydrolase family 130 protein [Streptosporangiaceae bacterium]|nr:glycoside hydrolase family 130 protein [Streptosporangiaceae bacterium]